MDRPKLSRELDSKTFLNYYYLKEELVEFLKENDMEISGGKIELTKRIAHFLDTNEKDYVGLDKKKKSPIPDNLSLDTIIEPNMRYSEKHRAFFESYIGKSFSFKVPFQRWLKANVGKTYKDAIDAYYEIMKNKDKGIKQIDKQFEYNTYIRDFFLDNKDKSLDDAIKCWKYKKSLPGSNKYEKEDLVILIK